VDTTAFGLFIEDDAELVADLTVDIVAKRLPERFGLDPRRDVQMLCPMHRGAAEAGVLNEKLQEALTPSRPTSLSDGSVRVYRVGDKTTQIRNNYDKGTSVQRIGGHCAGNLVGAAGDTDLERPYVTFAHERKPFAAGTGAEHAGKPATVLDPYLSRLTHPRAPNYTH
jgi:hypothetical protein